jgi:hypothetical protein
MIFLMSYMVRHREPEGERAKEASNPLDMTWMLQRGEGATLMGVSRTCGCVWYSETDRIRSAELEPARASPQQDVAGRRA